MALTRGRWSFTRNNEVRYYSSCCRHHEPLDPVVFLILLGLVAIAGAIYIIVTIIKVLMAIWIAIAVALALVALYFVFTEIFDFAIRRRVYRYLELAPAAVNGELAPEQRSEFMRLARSVRADNQARTIGEEGIYGELVTKVLADGWVTEDEANKLASAEQLFSMDRSTALGIKRWAFNGFLTWLGEDLSADQENSARAVALRLGIPPSEVEQRVGKLAQQRELRERAARAEQEALTRAEQEEWDRVIQAAAQRANANAVFDVDQRSSVRVRIKLRKGERCWYTTQCALIQPGNPSKRPGTLYVTSDRLIFMDGGATAIRLAAILDVAADPESGILHVVADGQKTPFEIELSEPLVGLAHVERSLAELPDNS